MIDVQAGRLLLTLATLHTLRQHRAITSVNGEGISQRLRRVSVNSCSDPAFFYSMVLHLGVETQTGGWRQLQSEELRNLYSASNVIRTFKSREMN